MGFKPFSPSPPEPLPWQLFVILPLFFTELGHREVSIISILYLISQLLKELLAEVCVDLGELHEDATIFYQEKRKALARRQNARAGEEVRIASKQGKALDKIPEISVEQALTPCEAHTAEQGRYKIDDGRLQKIYPHITSSAFKIYCALVSRLGSEDTRVVMSARELQETTGYSEHTVRRGLNKLERELKLITRIGENAQRGYLLNEAYLCR